MIGQAKKWIKEHPESTQEWDAKGYKIPGGHRATRSSQRCFRRSLRICANGSGRTDAGPAPHHVRGRRGAQVDFDNADKIETRYFVDLATGQVSKNMIKAFFFDLQNITKGGARPEGFEPYRAKKLVVLGAGMMGAGIAYVSARSGMEVVLKDVSLESAQKGKDYSRKILDKAVSRGKMTQDAADEVLDRITATDNPADAKGADLLIEAVFEDPSLKHKVYAEIEPYMADDALLASNTSTLPITGLAEGISRPADFIGMHFFLAGRQDAAAGDRRR